MEIKIGVQHAAREVVLDSVQEPAEVIGAVTKALEKGTLLQLEDDRGRTVLVPADRIAYVEIGEQVERRVGFGAM